MVLLISYDLRGRERPSAYDAVRGAIERHAISFRRPRDRDVLKWRYEDRLKAAPGLSHSRILRGGGRRG